MRRTFLALALVVGALAPATGLAVLPASGATGSIGIRLLEAPRSAGADPRARIYVVDHLAPGTVIHRRIELSNTTNRTLPVVVYPAAAGITAGLFSPAEGRTPNELTTWTKTDRASLSLGRQARSTVVVAISVPADASSGERYAVLWVEHRSAPPVGGGVTVVNRVGIRIYLSVGRGGKPPSSFVVDTLTARRSEAGLPLVAAQVRNTGARALDLSGTLQLSDGPGGLHAGPFPVRLGTTLAPGQSAPVTVLLDRQVPDGPWLAELKLRSGLLEQSTEATIRFPSATGNADPVRPKPADTGLPWWVLPLAIGAAVLLLGGLMLLLVARRRRVRRAGR